MNIAAGAGSSRVSFITPEDFARLARLVQAEGGLSLPASKAPLVRARLARRVRALGLTSFADYVDLVSGPGVAATREREEMLYALTTNVTRFFREPHHFDVLCKQVLPGLVARARAGGRVRLWSAGCSTGEEAYTLAMLLLEAMPEAATLDVQVLATDLDRRVLAIGRSAIYPGRVAQQVPPLLLARYFRQVVRGEEAGYSVGPAPRALVRFRQLNLIRPWPIMDRFDVVFCRNVVIYFDSATERDVWMRISDRMSPGSILFIGHSERINTADLPMFRGDGVTAYRKV